MGILLPFYNRISEERFAEKKLLVPGKVVRTGLSATAVKDPVPSMRLPWEND